MQIPSSQYEQVKRGTTRNRVVSWLAGKSYRASATAGALFGLVIGVMSNLERLLPSLSPQQAFSLRGLTVASIVSATFGVILGLLVAASARGVAKVYLRVGSGERPA
jgi:uncharacterized protein YacL